MIKHFLIALIFLTIPQAYAFEDFIISTDGKLTDIKIEDNSIINIYPLVTINNQKDTLFVIPLKEGQTSFSVLKDDKEKFDFEVVINESHTRIKPIEGFSIVPLDAPPEVLDCDIDMPPISIKEEKEKINIDGAFVEIDSDSEEN